VWQHEARGDGVGVGVRGESAWVSGGVRVRKRELLQA
jgi:hypothetical protein